MKDRNKVYTTELEDLQVLRDEAIGESRNGIQEKIDDHFFKNPTKVKTKKKKIRMDEEDMW